MDTEAEEREHKYAAEEKETIEDLGDVLEDFVRAKKEGLLEERTQSTPATNGNHHSSENSGVDEVDDDEEENKVKLQQITEQLEKMDSKVSSPERIVKTTIISHKGQETTSKIN